MDVYQFICDIALAGNNMPLKSLWMYIPRYFSLYILRQIPLIFNPVCAVPLSEIRVTLTVSWNMGRKTQLRYLDGKHFRKTDNECGQDLAKLCIIILSSLRDCHGLVEKVDLCNTNCRGHLLISWNNTLILQGKPMTHVSFSMLQVSK